MSNTSTENNTSTCANCGKGEDSSIKLKTCTACKLVKYCSRDCQIAHRPQHKKDCKKRAKELHDEKLFKQPPPDEDCPICFLRLPTLVSASVYMSCCGKMICGGCIHAVKSRAAAAGRLEEDDICPFCRTPPPTTDEESLRREKKRIELNDAFAMYSLGNYYDRGLNGLPQSYAKALELWHRAGKLGNARAYHNIAGAYELGTGVERDKEKVTHYLELAAMGGHVYARCNLGIKEIKRCKLDRALKHWMIAIRGGSTAACDNTRQLYQDGMITKEDFEKSLRLYQAYLDEIKSDQRDEAAAFSEEYRYIKTTTTNTKKSGLDKEDLDGIEQVLNEIEQKLAKVEKQRIKNKKQRIKKRRKEASAKEK